jgi:hypothetical protein
LLSRVSITVTSFRSIHYCDLSFHRPFTFLLTQNVFSPLTRGEKKKKAYRSERAPLLFGVALPFRFLRDFLLRCGIFCKKKMKRVVKNGATGARQAYLNKNKFDPNRYKQEKDRISKETEFVMTSLCCRRCCEIIQWKVDFGKYTPQEMARRCNLCHKKKVTLPYHRICQGCSEKNAVCAKCQKAPSSERNEATEGSSDVVSDEDREEVGEQHKYDFVELPVDDEELRRLKGLNVRVLQQRLHRKREEEEREVLRTLRERERRTVLRKAAVREDASDSDENL